MLVTGASGYIGGRLVSVLLERGNRVRCLVRTPGKVRSAPWYDSAEIVQGDVGGDLGDALKGVDAAFYLVHSIGSSPEWAEHDRAVAENVRRAADAAGVRRIVYLGELVRRHGLPRPARAASRCVAGRRVRGRRVDRRAEGLVHE